MTITDSNNADSKDSIITPDGVSSEIHEQGESELCWSFANSTVLKNSIYRLSLEMMKNGKISRKEHDSVLEKIGHQDFHNKLRKEMVYIVIPRNPKTSVQSETNQTSYVGSSMEKLCYPT